MAKGIKAVLNMYNGRGLEVEQINGDNKFACIRDEVIPATLNIVAAEEHVGDIERSVRTIKERTRCHVHRLPYKRYPKEMIVGFITYVTK